MLLQRREERAWVHSSADKATQTNGLSLHCALDDQEHSDRTLLLVVVGILPRLTAALASYREVAESAQGRRWRIFGALGIYTYIRSLSFVLSVRVTECNSQRNGNSPAR